MRLTYVTAALLFGLAALPTAAAHGGLQGGMPAPAAWQTTTESADLGTVSELEAKLWVLNAGYDQVSGLTRDGTIFYRGTALLDGDKYDVVVDAAGNVLGIKE